MVNKKELADYIAANNGLSKKTSLIVIDDILNYISASLQAGDVVNFKDFGKFSSKTKLARVGRNPKTGLAVNIAAKVAVSFKPSSALKKQIQ